MYTQAIDLPGKDPKPERAQGPQSPEDARFDAKLADDQKVEPRDWMPERLSQDAACGRSRSTRIPRSSACCPRATGSRARRRSSARRSCSPRCRTRAATACTCTGAAETLGVSRDQMIAALHSGKAKYSSIFNYPTLTWADVGVIGWLVDGAAIMNQIPLCRCSYGPYARAMIRICKEESFHQRQGFDALLAMMRGTPAQKAMVQDAVDRWWWPVLMMFGPPTTTRTHSAQSMKWGIKRDLERRPAAEVRRRHGAAGRVARRRSCPIRTLKWNAERGHYDFGAIDWDEFWRVVNGDGPCNRERLATRVTAYEEGRWVREAALAYAREAARSRKRRRRREENGRWRQQMAAVGGLHPLQAGPRPQALRQPARGRRAEAIQMARDVYTRRQEGVSIWVVPSTAITGLRPGRARPRLFEPMADKIYRHPTFYELPDEVNHM